MNKKTEIFNIYDSAKRSLHFFQSAVDYWADNVPFFNYIWDFDEQWTALIHNHWDHSENPGRWLYGSVFTRIMLGIEDELPVEKAFKKQIYTSRRNGEAFSFSPRPSPYEADKKGVDAAADQLNGIETADYVADMWDNRSVFTGLMLSYEVNGDKEAYEAAEKMARQFQTLLWWEGDCAYLTKGAYEEGYDVNKDEKFKQLGQNVGGWISPLIHFYKISGDESALKTAVGIANAFVSEYDMLIASESEKDLAFNCHSALYTIAGVVRVYKETGDPELLKWANMQYQDFLKQSCSATGWTLEFLPYQNLGKSNEASCEICATADRVDSGIQLATSGFPEYWNDVKRSTVNYLYEGQIKDPSWLPENSGTEVDTFYRNYHMARERAVGSYVGWGGFNDLYHKEARVKDKIQNCCGPHGAFAMYQAWHYAIQHSESTVSVNLDISRDSDWCTVVSHDPLEGKIDVKMKTSCRLKVRMSDWVEHQNIEVFVDGHPASHVMEGDYVTLEVEKDQKISVLYPLRKVTTTETINKQNYQLHWIGDYVMEIDPKGDVAPIYQRNLEALKSQTCQEPDSPKYLKEVHW